MQHYNVKTRTWEEQEVPDVDAEVRFNKLMLEAIVEEFKAQGEYFENYARNYFDFDPLKDWRLKDWRFHFNSEGVVHVGDSKYEVLPHEIFIFDTAATYLRNLEGMYQHHCRKCESEPEDIKGLYSPLIYGTNVSFGRSPQTKLDDGDIPLFVKPEYPFT